MKINRAIITTATLLIAVLCAAGSASANPLLSGYGGPGQGSQAILGSALLNGPPGGGGGATGGGGSTGAGSSTGGGDEVGGHADRASGASGEASDPTGAGRDDANGARKASGDEAQAYIASSRFASSQNGGSQTLGLSGEDVRFMILALALLTATAAITRRLARRPR
jgi:hypothetical protein